MNTTSNVGTDNQIPKYNFIFPEDIVCNITNKLIPLDVIHFLSTCTSFQSIKDKVWEKRSYRDFNWRCTPEMGITANTKVNWTKFYKMMMSDATNIHWEFTFFKLGRPLTHETTQIEFDTDGNLFLIE